MHSFSLNVVCAGTNDYGMRGGEGQDLQVGNQHGGEIKGTEHPLTRESSTCCSEDPPLLLRSAVRNGQVLCHSAGGTGGDCPDGYERSPSKLC